jgi:multidrug transporter EmrE-like cation transporter
MAVAATWVTLHTAYIGYLFFQQSFPELPVYYVWAIRIGIILFTIFSLEGFAMGGRMSHSVGAINDNSNWLILGWSKTVGDLRVAHFIGMHAIQVLPILSFYLLKNTKATIFVGLLYGVLAFSVLFQALKGKPLLGNTDKQSSIDSE